VKVFSWKRKDEVDNCHQNTQPPLGQQMKKRGKREKKKKKKTEGNVFRPLGKNERGEKSKEKTQKIVGAACKGGG